MGGLLCAAAQPALSSISPAHSRTDLHSALSVPKPTRWVQFMVSKLVGLGESSWVLTTPPSPWPPNTP